VLFAVATALLAGALTTLAPCALSLLPVIVAGSLQEPATSGGRPSAALGGVGGRVAAAGGPGRGVGGVGTAVASRTVRRPGVRRALVVTGSLGASVFLFTLALRATTALIGIPPAVWQWLSGGLLVALGVTALFPGLWDRVSMTSGLSARSARGLAAASRRDGDLGAVLTGAALGPVFTSCSPLYGYVVVTVLPAEPARGLVLLTAYVVGLVSVLLVVALMGQRVVRRLRWAADPHSPFRRGLGLVFVVVGALVATGLMQDAEAWVLEHAPVAPWEIGQDIGR
jgi:cytochrome c biogenesis protein CcdA